MINVWQKYTNSLYIIKCQFYRRHDLSEHFLMCHSLRIDSGGDENSKLIISR